MRLGSIFEKKVNRPIEGVIKADDAASLDIEFEEYVLTNEVSMRLEDFLDAYNNYNNANGVWISGFFGSGKSHLLKILALLLENKEVKGIKVLDTFLPKCGDNEILRGQLKKAVEIPSSSILFNIDQKAVVVSKTQIDALLSVFIKVFDEFCGYYGKQGHIAKLERDLDDKGLYDKFKLAYKEVSGQVWEKGREAAILESNNISAAYSTVAGVPKESAAGILDKYRNEYKVSIEDFAEQILRYVDRKGPNFRLNFYVDEVGQYIADNVKLMTNLQTIAESLATKCRGRAWVIVTAQEDMNKVVGEMGKQQGNDFTKIQARFANRMKLTSTDVAEVIQKRLLKKTEKSIPMLSELYHAHFNNFKTLFDFADGSKSYQNFKDRDHFIQCYPFIPYQFSLFQSAIENLSQHNAFEGKHSSVGERSMLAVFQQVAITISEHEMNHLATFDLMFEGIRSALLSQIQRSVLQAEKHLSDEFALRVLKALFLVKYVKDFKATVRNLTALMVEELNQDLAILRAKIEGAVNLLEQQTYIQRNGDEYEFLTDEEKDVEQEIKNTDVEESDVAETLNDLIFIHTIKPKKIRFDQNGQDFSFSKKQDDKFFGKEQELTIHIITPFYEHSGNIDVIRAHSMGRDQLVVILPDDDRLVSELLMYERTEKHVSQNISSVQQESVKRILEDKRHQNKERYTALQVQVAKLIGKAKLLINGETIELSTEDAQSRIIQGFHELIIRSYPNLKMLKGINYAEGDVVKFLQQGVQGVIGTELTEAEREMLAFIQNQNNSNVRTTVKALVEKFEKKPNGWPYAAILCILAKLCARGKVEVRQDSNLLEDTELDKALRNTQQQGSLVLESQVEFTPAQVNSLKTFYSDFFDEPASSVEARTLGKNTALAFGSRYQYFAQLIEMKAQFPFLQQLEEPLKLLKELSLKSYGYFLKDFRAESEHLLDIKEKILDPISRFISGSMKTVYTDARTFLKDQESNFADAASNEPARIREILDNPRCFSGNQMQQVKGLLDALKSSIDRKVSEQQAKASVSIDILRNRLAGLSEYSSLSDSQKEQLAATFENFLEDLKGQALIPVIRDKLRRFEEQEFPEMLTRISAWTQPEPISAGSIEPSSTKSAPLRAEPKVEYVSIRLLNVTFEKAYISNEVDLEKYLECLKAAISTEIEKGKRVQI